MCGDENVPSYADLGKCAKDVYATGFNFGKGKINITHPYPGGRFVADTTADLKKLAEDVQNVNVKKNYFFFGKFVSRSLIGVKNIVAQEFFFFFSSPARFSENTTLKITAVLAQSTVGKVRSWWSTIRCRSGSRLFRLARVMRLIQKLRCTAEKLRDFTSAPKSILQLLCVRNVFFFL